MDTTMDGYDETLMTAEEQPERRYAGFWMRFWAYLVDALILFSVNGLLLSPLGLMNNGEPYDIGFWTMNSILAGVIYYVYFALMTKFFHQTIGKMIFGLKVISADKERPVWSDILFREVVSRFIYNLFTIFKLLYVVVGFTKNKQGLHDYLGKTYVIHERN